MTSLELNEIANQRLSDPKVLGRIVCNLRSDNLVQRHHDEQQYSASWQDSGDFWRCTIFAQADPSLRLAQVDIYQDATLRADLFEPARITVSHEEGILCITRYKAR
jgi:hypothetical protein